jgi:hypothetical protein
MRMCERFFSTCLLCFQHLSIFIVPGHFGFARVPIRDRMLSQDADNFILPLSTGCSFVPQAGKFHQHTYVRNLFV